MPGDTVRGLRRSGALRSDAGRSRVTRPRGRRRSVAPVRPLRTIPRGVNRPPTWPALASGSLSSLFRVLCTIRSLYNVLSVLCRYSAFQGIHLAFQLHSQAAVLLGATGSPTVPADSSLDSYTSRGSHPLWRTIPDHFASAIAAPVCLSSHILHCRTREPPDFKSTRRGFKLGHTPVLPFHSPLPRQSWLF